MPLTAYSISQPGEYDVDQTLNLISSKFGQSYTGEEPIPENVRTHLRTDLQCPSCFVTGAEVVRSAVKKGKGSRQSFFRFTTPGHRPHCDFSNPETSNVLPENLVSLTESKSNLTRAVRDLVCTGIQHGVFTQISMRNMREWFFIKKVESLFLVTVDPLVFTWLAALEENSYRAIRALPVGVDLTLEIAALPQFDWRAEAARNVTRRYPEHALHLKTLRDQRVSICGAAGTRAKSLAQRFQGRTAFDPTVLSDEYGKARTLAQFIGHNHGPLKGVKDSAGASSVLAFSALLLYVRGWDLSLAIADFSRIAVKVGGANQNLGNVMGLNPFHDYEAWKALKHTQELKIITPDNIDISAERLAMEVALRREFGAPQMLTH